MSLNTKISMDLAPLLTQEIKKYESIIHMQVLKALDNANIEEMIEKITLSLISQNINQRMHDILSIDTRINELISKKIRESIEGIDLWELLKLASEDIIKEMLEDKYKQGDDSY